jgi:hypothetical protein
MLNADTRMLIGEPNFNCLVYGMEPVNAGHVKCENIALIGHASAAAVSAL